MTKQPTPDRQKNSRKPPLGKRLVEDAPSDVRNEHQQHDDIAGEGLIELGAGEFAERGGDRLLVEEADDGFLDDGQDDPARRGKRTICAMSATGASSA
jgi:hypothetical protein